VEKIVECVPNVSEGRDKSALEYMGNAISKVPGVKLLDMDPDASYHRCVITFAGEPDACVEAMYQLVLAAREKIDMTIHKGEHPRHGAVDVAPFVPIKGVTLADCAELARQLGKRVGDELGIPVYLYESAASTPERKNLANVRKGEYEALPLKLKDPQWKPDFGPAKFVPRFGVLTTGARFFLIAYNVNLATTDVEKANSIAYAIRELGDVQRNSDGNPVLRQGKPVRIPGKLRMVKAMGVFLEQHQFCQVSINLTHFIVNAPHIAFEEAKLEAEKLGVKVTGSEVVGLIPLAAMLMAGEYYMFIEGTRTDNTTEEELVKVAHDRLGLSDYNPFDPKKKIIEYMI
jgi:glutamate formiminotransferase/formiminotetrahydrofolate cyclodeaminase